MSARKRKETNQNSGRKTMARNILEGIKKDEILSSAQKVINSAVNVLEEEIAAGILAAKKIEKKVLDVDNIRSDPDDLMNRIRRDTHEAVDLFLDALSAISKQVNTLASMDKKENSEVDREREQPSTKSPALTLLEAEKPLTPGQTELFAFTLMEDSRGPKRIKFQKTHLFGPNNQTINSRALKITPSAFSLKPQEEKEINISLNLPKNAQAGIYNGFITDTDNSLIKVVLHIQVI